MATITGLTAEKTLELEGETVVSGLIDTNGHLILYTRAGSSIDAGKVKGDMATNPGHPGAYTSALTYTRVATIDGIRATTGSQLIFDFSGGGVYSNLAKYSARVHVGQRGDNTLEVDVYELGDTSGNVTWGVVAKGTYLFELWVRLPGFAGPVEVQPKQVWNAQITYDQETPTIPVGWTTAPVTVQRMSQRDPVGSVIMFPGSVIPDGWLTCTGQLVSRTTYRDLFTALGTRYGAGDGSTTFGLPDFRGLVPVGVDPAQTEFDTLGKTGGEKTHLLTAAEMPSHTHTQNSHGHTVSDPGHSHRQVVTANSGGSALRNDFSSDGAGGVFDQGANTNASGTGVTIQGTTAVNQSTGGGGAHNNLQPYRAINFIIKT